MYEELKQAKDKVVGLKQLMRQLSQNNVEVVYLAQDADEALKSDVKTAAMAHGARVVMVEKMEDLGETCGIDVPAACAGIIKGEPS